METKVNENANPSATTYDINVMNVYLFRGNEQSDVDYRKTNSVRVYFDSTIPGHAPDENGIKTRTDVNHITFSDAAYRFHLLQADARLNMLVNENTNTEFLGNLLKGANISITRTLTTKDNGEETYNTNINTIAFALTIENAIQTTFDAVFAKNLGF